MQWSFEHEERQVVMALQRAAEAAQLQVALEHDAIEKITASLLLASREGQPAERPQKDVSHALMGLCFLTLS